MHFVGMFAYSLPIKLDYQALETLLSWVAAVMVSAIALGLASGGKLSPGRFASGALTMGAGICAMHYIGMSALDLSPPIVWNYGLVAASALIAVAASAAALLIFFWLRGLTGAHVRIYKAAAALVMGLAISGMHYTGMAAANVSLDAICRSAGALSGGPLGSLVIVATLGLLSMTLFTSTLDARLHTRAVNLASSLRNVNTQLQSANDELQRRAFLDPLTDLPNRLLFEDRLHHALMHNARPDPHGMPSRKQDRIAVMCIDLDGFKAIDDSLGHAAGDEMLREVGRRLTAITQESDTLAHIGGDEFMLLSEDQPDVPDCADGPAGC